MPGNRIDGLKTIFVEKYLLYYFTTEVGRTSGLRMEHNPFYHYCLVAPVSSL